MKINKAYKTELNPTKTQLSLLKQHAGTARFVYNWGLAKRIEEYKETGKSSNAMDQHKQLVELKKSEFPWMYEVSKCAPQEALRNLDAAYRRFFRNVKNGKKPGFPRFKSKHKGNDSFRLTGAVRVKHKTIKLPRIGEIKLKEKGYLPTEGVHILSATCSELAGRWFVSVQVEEEIPDPVITSDEVIGIDLGIKTLAVCSNGMKFENPKALKKSQKKLRHTQKSLSRKVKGSENRKKVKSKLAVVHYRVSNVRKDSIHKITSEVVKTKPSMIVLEDLSPSNMVKNHKLARSISDASFSEFRRQIEYKAKWAGIEVVIAPLFYPSSKLCSVCGYKNTELELKDRSWICPMCGTTHDRDINASNNLKQFGLSTLSLRGFQACGDDVRPSSEGCCLGSRNQDLCYV